MKIKNTVRLIALLGALAIGQAFAVAERTPSRPEPMASGEALKLPEEQKQDVATRHPESREMVAEQAAKGEKAPGGWTPTTVYFYATNNTGYDLSVSVTGSSGCGMGAHQHYYTIKQNDNETPFMKRWCALGTPNHFIVKASIDDLRYKGYTYTQSINVYTKDNHHFYITIKATPGTADADHQTPWLKLIPSLTKAN